MKDEIFLEQWLFGKSEAPVSHPCNPCKILILGIRTKCPHRTAGLNSAAFVLKTILRLNMQMNDVEDISEYAYGGYALVSIGKVLGKRYEVVDKLGHSVSATTWLCWVRDISPPKAAWVAVKLFKSKFSVGSATEMTKKELAKKGGSEEEWTAAHVRMPIDEFWQGDVHGSHRCLVMPLLGPSLESMEVTRRPTLKGYLYETALALEYLHRHHVAQGQVAPHNVRLQLDVPNANILPPRT